MLKQLILTVAIGSSLCAKATDYPFSASDSGAAGGINSYWNIYGVSEGAANANGYSGIFGYNEAWMEWDMLKICWTDHNGLRTAVKNWEMSSPKINGIGGITGAQPTGYVWSWGSSETWPDGSGTGHGGVNSYHFDQIPAYISAIFNYYIWTRDAAYLATMLPRAETVMDNYLLGTMLGNSGVIIVPGSANNGTSTGRPSTYMDQIRSGYKDGQLNAMFFTALGDLADLEQMNGNTTKETTYRNLYNQFSARYETAFWNSSTLRFAGWRDVNNSLHDAGYAWINLEALTRGLGSVSDAHHIFDWLENPCQAAAAGAHVGSTDMYDHVATVRSTSANVPVGDWDPWSCSQTQKPYGSILQNGGMALWFAYYDIMARLKYSTADDAWDKNWNLFNRMSLDSEDLSYSSGRSYNDFNEDFVENGTSQPFPESGISSLPFLNGFMGVNAKTTGLNIRPNLPSALVSAQATEVSYKGTNWTINVSRGTITDEEASHNVASALNPGHTLSENFMAPSPTFNEVGVYVGTYGTSSSAFTLDLMKYSGGVWSVVGTRRFTNVNDNTWCHMALGSMPGSTQYTLRMYAVSGSIAWWRNSSGTFSGTAYDGTTVLTGDFQLRFFNAPMNAVINLAANTVADSNNLQQQTFNTTVPFDRVSACVGTWGTTTSGCTMRLLRDVGGRWQIVVEQLFANVPDNSNMMMSMSEQPAGNYLLEMRDRVGTIGWWRNANGTYTGGYALNDGVQVAGDRRFSVYRGVYTITIQPGNITTTVNAGDTYILP